MIDIQVDPLNLCATNINTIRNDDNTSSDELIKDVVRASTQEIVKNLFALPTRISEDHTCVLVKLPLTSSIILPRHKPLPKKKELTRWEKFAKEKGIKTKKKERMVFNEEKQEWIPRHGYKSASNEEPWVIEVKDGEDPMADQYEKLRESKKERVSKNEKQQQRNLSEASGTTILSSSDSIKQEIARTLSITKTATASMGKFDKKLDTQGAIKVKNGKRKLSELINDKEKETELRVIKKVLDPSSKSTKSKPPPTPKSTPKSTPKKSKK